jgi:hypothetical protein
LPAEALAKPASRATTAEDAVTSRREQDNSDNTNAHSDARDTHASITPIASAYSVHAITVHHLLTA